MKSMPLAVVAGALVAAAPYALAAQQSEPSARTPAAPPGYEIPKNMTTYFIAMYVRGPKFIASQTLEREELSKRHLAFIRRMVERKTYLLAGPFIDDQGSQLGIGIIAAPNETEARRIAAEDPAIIAGHMAVELRAAMLPSLGSLVVTY